MAFSKFVEREISLNNNTYMQLNWHSISY